MLVRIYDEPYMHKFCAVDTFLNITHLQAMSPVAKFHHLLGRGFHELADVIDFYYIPINIYISFEMLDQNALERILSIFTHN